MELRINAKEMQEVLHQLFTKYNFTNVKAKCLSSVFTKNTLMGVNSHGINRVSSFIDFIEKGLVKIHAETEPIKTFDATEH